MIQIYISAAVGAFLGFLACSILTCGLVADLRSENARQKLKIDKLEGGLDVMT
jgi:hypothetical protein